MVKSSQSRTTVVVLSLVLAAMTVGLAPAAAVAASGPIDSTTRTASTTTATPGETITVTTEVTVGQEIDRMAIEENWGANVTSATISDVTFENGTGAKLAQPIDDERYTVALSGVSAGTTVVVEWELTLPESVGTGDSVTIDGSVTANGEKTTFDPLTIDVVELESSRTAANKTVKPGSSVSFTVNTTTYTNFSRLNIAESVAGDVTDVTIDGVTVDGAGELQAQVANDTEVDVPVANVTSGTTVSVTYTVTVNGSAAGGSNVTATGDVQFEDGSVSTGETSIRVVASVKDAVAGKDNQVDTRELQYAITSWATKQSIGGQEVTTKDLSEVILAWASGGSE